MEAPHPTQTGDISGKITSVAVGEAHTLALTVYSWGRGMFGRLGTGSEEDQLFPVRVSFFGSDDEKEDKLKIVGIAAGAYHSLALADDGSVWGWGYNIYLDNNVDGQIGVADENCYSPHLLECFSRLECPDKTKYGKPLKISSLEAGGMMSIAVDDHGSVQMWGNFPHPSQPHEPAGPTFSFISTRHPFPVWTFHGHTVVKVACGNEHVITLVTAGGGDLICYSWGSNTHGQLGLGDKESRSAPQIIENFNSISPWEVYDAACGAFHTALLAKRKSPSETLVSFCWTFGLGENGQLGHGTTRNSESPEMVEGLPQGAFWVSIGCGLFHTSVVSSEGEVWSWGMEKGLGLCPDARFTGTDTGDALLPLLVPRSGIYDSRFREPEKVACGGAHTILLTDLGYRMWSWGRGRSGVLGNGRTEVSYSPATVLWPPQGDDFGGNDRRNGNDGEKDVERVRFLESRLLAVERYASLLHGSIFGRVLELNEIPVCTLDIGKEWERMVDCLDERGLVRLEMFYRDMLAGVKDKLLKKRVQEMVKECLSLKASKSAE